MNNKVKMKTIIKASHIFTMMMMIS